MEDRHEKGAAAGSAANIERVLDAERECEKILEQARKSAEALIVAARAREEAIRKRADARIVRLHEAMKRRVDAEMARMRAEYEQSDAPAPGEADYAIGQEALREAVGRLAAEMTGGGDAQ